MATETEQLVYELQATADKFEASFELATKAANDNFAKMDAAGKDAGDRMSESMRSAVSSVAQISAAWTRPRKRRAIASVL